MLLAMSTRSRYVRYSPYLWVVSNVDQNRFAQQPDIYKQFLEILQTYQRESKPIQDVYAQVTRLFETATDLLEDFKQFLPESAAANQNKNLARATGEDAFPLSSTRNEPGYSAAVHSNAHLHQTPRPDHSKVPPMGMFAPTSSSNREHTNKRKRNDRQGAAAMTPTLGVELNNLGAKATLGQVANGNKVCLLPHIFLHLAGSETPAKKLEQCSNISHSVSRQLKVPRSLQHQSCHQQHRRLSLHCPSLCRQPQPQAPHPTTSASLTELANTLATNLCLASS